MSFIFLNDGQFMLDREIGAGAFGQCYRGRELKTGRMIAAKLEQMNTKAPQLRYEAKVYKLLAGSVGIPEIYWYGAHKDCNVLVMDLMGPSLEDLFVSCGRQFSLKTVLLLADEMISRLEFLHDKKFLHRDIKPENFLVGTEQNGGRVNMIDFGFAKKFCQKDDSHIPYKGGKGTIGTARYASIASHLGFEQGRKDDLESLGYVIMYFLRGKLPWQGLKADTYSGWNRRVLHAKQQDADQDLCNGYPLEFASYFEHCRTLAFSERPDYAMLKQRFRDLFNREGYVNDGNFEWIIDAQGQVTPQSTLDFLDVEDLADPPDAWLSAVSRRNTKSPMSVTTTNADSATFSPIPASGTSMPRKSSTSFVLATAFEQDAIAMA